MATLRKMRELRSRDSRALQKGVFVQLSGVPHSWLQRGYREWTHLDSRLLDSLQPPTKQPPLNQGSLYSTVDRANLSCMEASLRSPSRSPVRPGIIAACEPSQRRLRRRGMDIGQACDQKCPTVYRYTTRSP